MNDQQKMIATLNSGGVGIVRTDTLYGIVARADDESAVERIFQIKARDRDKPLIVLLPDASSAYDAAETIAEFDNAGVPTTLIVDSPHAFSWLRHSDGSVGYRVPKSPELQTILRHTGPLVAPSANPQGAPPAFTVEEAQAYFGDAVDYYLDGGEVPSDQAPSQIFKRDSDDSLTRLR